MRLIEEYMIAANVAAALTLGRSRWPTMYRVHDEPEPERVAALRKFLESLGLKLAAGQRLRPSHFNAVMARVKDTPHEAVVNQIVLRTQAQAIYSPDSAQHFGLALRHYVHFTSPIRRYADLLVHRGLISALGLGEDGLPAPDVERFARTAEHISATERRAMIAERDATDRYLAAFLSDKVGAMFAARIAGVTSAGLFVTLVETGASALIPMRTIGDERLLLDESQHRLVGERTHLVLQLGDAVEVRLREATAASGGLLAELIEGGRIDKSARPKRGGGRQRFGPPRRRRR
jgi:ribonuclease R